MLDKVHHARQSKTLLFDLDSTHSDTYGKQEQSAYNAHYGTVGFHPLVAFDGLTGDFLKAQLRPGNVYTSNGVVDFMRPLIEHYNEKFPETTSLVRGDSGFAVPALYELCENESVFYIIRLKSNAKLKSLAEELHPVDEIQDVTVTESYVEESIYQATSWSKPRRVIIQSTRPVGELFFTHAFFVTSLGETFSPQAIVHSYKQRGTMENFIKEAKNGFGFDQMKSNDFLVNEVRMMFSLLDIPHLRKLQAIDPLIPTSDVIALNVGRIPKTESEYLSLEVFSVTGKLVKDANRNDKKIFVWTVNKEGLMHTHMRMGVYGLITNHVSNAVKVRNDYEEEQGLLQRLLWVIEESKPV